MPPGGPENARRANAEDLDAPGLDVARTNLKDTIFAMWAAQTAYLEHLNAQAPDIGEGASEEP